MCAIAVVANARAVRELPRRRKGGLCKRNVVGFWNCKCRKCRGEARRSIVPRDLRKGKSHAK